MPYREICPICNGTGKDINLAIGLGRNSMLPAYVMSTCPRCHGAKFVDATTEPTPSIEIELPFSFIAEWWKRLGKV